MKIIVMLLGAALLLQLCRAEVGQFPQELRTFSRAKEQQVRTLARDLRVKVPPEINEFFKSAARGDYAGVSNVMARLASEYMGSYQRTAENLPAWIPLWQPLTEVEGAYATFAEGGTKYPLAFGADIIKSIPSGSIYFGGTDAGRILVTALCKSHERAEPFFTLTQNALSDSRYLDYLRTMYGQQLSLPTPNEVQQAIEEYQADALLRLKHDREFPREPKQVKQGENIQVVDGQVQMNNAVSVMEVHARLVKLILKRNPKPDFYWEESYPLDLLYPHLTPHGLIFKLHHDPLPAMASSTLDADNKFWTGQCQAMVGQWLNLDTSVSNICAFAKTVYGRKDWSQFTGDRAFVTNKFAMKAYSKLRVSIAGLYHWRMTQKFKADDTARLRGEADYAFRQAYALSPSDPEVVFRYVTFLTEQSRYDDAIRLVGVAAKLSPENRLFDQLLSQLRNRQ